MCLDLEGRLCHALDNILDKDPDKIDVAGLEDELNKCIDLIGRIYEHVKPIIVRMEKDNG
jgi:hypothetical protein